ncbi:hypothetical protein B0H21DRAFT_460358 [Amylocystis lapponica]|nr:hypothetical protein B0H21DRAFT_460358 [Amylocystis lapponica]
MSRHFCCCIPVRAAVFIFSLFSLLGTGALAALAWYTLYEIDRKSGKYSNVMSQGKIIDIVVGSISTFMALISLFGFVGSITRNKGFVKSYSYMTWILFALSLVSAGLYEYLVWSGRPLNRACVNVDGQENISVEDCSVHLSTWLKVAVTAVMAIVVGVHLYIVVVIRRYVSQLEDDDGAWKGMYSLTTTDANQGLLHQPAYPYADAAHSYGNA